MGRAPRKLRFSSKGERLPGPRHQGFLRTYFWTDEATKILGRRLSAKSIVQIELAIGRYVIEMEGIHDRLDAASVGRSQIGAGVAFLDRAPDQRIFRFHQGGHLRDLLATAMSRAGVSFPRRQRGFHLFCHTYATWMMHYGKLDNYGLARTGRWKDPRSAEGYLHTVVGSEARMADVLPTPPKRAKGVQRDSKSA